jgi:hypothetical protein
MTKRSLLLSMLLIGGCASGPHPMIEVKPSMAIQARPDAATVVFVRPGSPFGWALVAPIVDEAGRYIAELPVNAHVATNVAPGHHMFVTWGENTDALQADLAPGHIYFVEMYITPGAFSGHWHMKAIKPSYPNWGRKDEWMTKTRQFSVDPGAAQMRTADWSGKVPERLRRGNEHLAKYQGEEIDSRTLQPGDGI